MTRSPFRLLACFASCAAASAAPVINEIHYNNDLNTICNEFVELHNPDAADVDLSGWQLTGAIEFTFPAGTTLPASGYLVVGEDPATLTSEFGITALGPYSGNINSEGESLELVDTSLTEVDVVDYGVGFPWPSLAAGDGSSMELINPNLDNDLGSSWRSSGTGFGSQPPLYNQEPPSPGAQNGAYAASAPPNTRQVQHAPESPTSADPVIISAKITDPDGVAQVTLSYQIVEPGDYTRRSDPEYHLGWTDLPMVDMANDSIYSATIPAAEHRELVRYRITSVDGNGASARAPFLDDSQPNFAFFVYDGVPAWTGANEPGVDAPMTFPSELLDDLPTYHLIADASDVTNSQFNSGFNNTRFFGSLVYDGEVYDHITFEVGGTGSTYIAGKNKWRIYFNPARDLEARDNDGKKFGESWNKLTMNACASPRVAGHRGMAGLDEALSFRIHQLTGSLSPSTSYLHFRVIDEAVETSPTDQYSGDLWGLYLAIEEIDGSLLDDRDLPDGNVYNAGGSRLEHQAKNQVTNGTDWSTFTSQSNNTNTETWWRENLDLDRYYSFRASNRVVGNVDLRYSANHYFYHGTNDDGTQSRWTPIPWDVDMMFISVSHWSGTVRQENCLSHSAIEIEFQNRCREVLDLLLDDPSFDGGQIGQLVDEFSEILNPTGQALTWADLDRNMWNNNPRSNTNTRSIFDHRGNFFLTPYTESRRGGTWTRTLESADFEGQRKYLLDYMTNSDPDPASWSINSGDQQGYGYNFLTSEAANSGIPDTPVISYTGAAGFPANELNFQSSVYSDPQGTRTDEAIQWRIGETSAIPGEPNIYEIQENWTSPVLTAFDLNITPPASAVVPGRTYRARVRHLDEEGHWSHWSAPLEFVAGVPDVSGLQQSLVISEIMYNPATGQEHEYIELRNISESPLDLTNVRFTDGINYDFPSGTMIDAGAYLLVVKNPAAFEAHYGSGLPVVGTYGLSDSASLSNGGESITLALGTFAIHEFEYNDKAPWPIAADGAGGALVLYSTSDDSNQGSLDPLGHGVAANWRQGVSGGTPGVGDPSSLFAGDPNADEDADGLSAILEHALGSSDSEAGSADLAFAFDGSQMTINFPRNPLASDVLYTVEVSADLETWTVGGVLDQQDATTATYTFEPASGDAQRYFMRLRVKETSPIQQ